MAPEQLEIGKVNSVHFLRADDWNDVDRDPSKSSVTLLSSQQAQHSRFISSAFRSWKEAQHTMIVSGTTSPHLLLLGVPPPLVRRMLCSFLSVPYAT